MSAWVKGFLQAVPATGRDQTDNIVELPNADDPPPALHLTWTEIMRRKREIARMESRLAAEEASLASLTATAHQTISKHERAIADERAKLAEDQNRWVMMTRTLGIDIQEGDEA